jgi:hypothetical protein
MFFGDLKMVQVLAGILLFVLLANFALAEISEKSSGLGNAIDLRPLLCYIGMVVAPLVSIYYMFAKCLVKENIGALGCIASDLLVGLLSTLTATGIFCFVFPPGVDEMIEEIAELVVNQLIL